MKVRRLFPMNMMKVIKLILLKLALVQDQDCGILLVHHIALQQTRFQATTSGYVLKISARVVYA